MKTSNLVVALAVVLAGAALAPAQEPATSEHARKTLEIYRYLIEADTSKRMGNTPKVVRYLADELIAAGFPRATSRVVPPGTLASLMARTAATAPPAPGPSCCSRTWTWWKPSPKTGSDRPSS